MGLPTPAGSLLALSAPVAIFLFPVPAGGRIRTHAPPVGGLAPLGRCPARGRHAAQTRGVGIKRLIPLSQKTEKLYKCTAGIDTLFPFATSKWFLPKCWLMKILKEFSMVCQPIFAIKFIIISMQLLYCFKIILKLPSYPLLPFLILTFSLVLLFTWFQNGHKERLEEYEHKLKAGREEERVHRR